MDCSWSRDMSEKKLLNTFPAHFFTQNYLLFNFSPNGRKWGIDCRDMHSAWPKRKFGWIFLIQTPNKPERESPLDLDPESDLSEKLWTIRSLRIVQEKRGKAHSPILSHFQSFPTISEGGGGEKKQPIRSMQNHIASLQGWLAANGQSCLASCPGLKISEGI